MMNDMEICTKIKEIIPLGETRKLSYLAQCLHIKRDVIDDAVSSGICSGLDLIVGVRCGAGVGYHEPKEYEVEHYE